MYAVIIAGGSGTRFWPKSRANLPKQFINFLTDKPIIKETVERILPIIPTHKIYVVGLALHEKLIYDSLKELDKKNIILEPIGRNTLPAIALAAIKLNKINPDEPMLVLPSDHVIAKNKEFLEILKKIECDDLCGDSLLTFGIIPQWPACGYGYIRTGKEIAKNLFTISAFKEKPSGELAKKYLQDGNYLWNSGMFVFKPKIILEEIKRYSPEIYDILLKIDEAPALINSIYNDFPNISIDYGVMEKSKNAKVFKCDIGWSDVGSWEALWNLEKKDENSNVLSGNTISVDSHNCFVLSDKRLIATIGLDDCVIVDTNDCLLIAKKNRSEDVKKIIEELKLKKLNKFL
jgi:mannose-1-phosphate guanylyltransferase